MKRYNVQQLNELYRKADNADSTLFSEQKSNVLLVNSEHYKHLERKMRERSDDLRLSDRQKIRITKNHTQRITNRIINGIMGLSPELKVVPANTSELQDKKSAELYQSVLQYGIHRYKLDEKKEDWCADFVEIGECAVKVYFDKSKGDIVSYQQLVDPETSKPLYLTANNELTFDPVTITIDVNTMMPMQSENKPAPDYNKPVYSGDFCFETILPFNLLRHPECESMDESPYLIVRKMMDKEELKNMIPEDDPEREQKLDYIKSSSETTYKIFDAVKATFEEQKEKIMLKEYYFKPGSVYGPNGYFYITTEYGVLFEGEIPFGVYPISYRGFKKIQTSARARSVVKVLRPYQYEINRAASKMVEHQLVHGDDKVITPLGGKFSQGSEQPGVRHFQATGQPIVIQGRTGEQYAGYVDAQIQEMYQVVDEIVDDQDAPQTLDAYTLLFRSISRKKKYGKYAKEFQAFLKEVYWTYLKLAKNYFDETTYIRAVGRREAINIAEFKSADPLSVQINLSESNDDAESLLGRTIMLQQIMQYVGKDLPPQALGKLLTNIPFANGDQIFNSLTLTERNVENCLLALDRGEWMPAEPDDKHEAFIEALSNRIISADFKLLPQMTQEMYYKRRDQHRQFLAEQEQKALMAQSEAVPMTGNFVKCDMYVMKDGKQVRATFPQDALDFLQKKLEQQGMTMARLELLSTADQAAVAQNMMMDQQQPMQGAFNGPTNGPIA